MWAHQWTSFYHTNISGIRQVISSGHAVSTPPVVHPRPRAPHLRPRARHPSPISDVEHEAVDVSCNVWLYIYCIGLSCARRPRSRQLRRHYIMDIIYNRNKNSEELDIYKKRGSCRCDAWEVYNDYGDECGRQSAVRYCVTLILMCPSTFVTYQLNFN